MTKPEITAAAVVNALIVKAQAGDNEARNQIVLDNMRLVTKRAAEAARRCGKSDHLQDIINTAVVGASDNDGLIHAIAKFDVTRGLRFSTYAVRWIDNAIQNALTQTSVVRLGRNSHGEARLRTVVAELTHEDVCAPTAREVRARCVFRGTAPPTDGAIARALLVTRAETLPGDAPDPSAHHKPDGDLRALTADEAPIDALEAREECQIVSSALAQLSPRQQYVVRHAYGLDGFDVSERADIAAALGISAGRVGHIHTAALKRLKELATPENGKPRNDAGRLPLSEAA